MNYVLLPCFFLSVAGLGVSVLDDHTTVPLPWFFGFLTSVLFAGMWVSSKVTRFEEQQTVNIQRLNAIDSRLTEMDDRHQEFHGHVMGLIERVSHIERRKQ